MYAQAVSKPYKQAHLNRFKGCAFSYEPCVCIKSLKLGESGCAAGGLLHLLLVQLRTTLHVLFFHRIYHLPTAPQLTCKSHVALRRIHR